MRNEYLPQDYNGRLDSTFVRYKEVVYFMKAREDYFYLYDPHDLNGEFKIKIDPLDKALDISSIPLGYFNSSNGELAVFISRLPVRKFKQGVHQSNVDTVALIGDKLTRVANDHLYNKMVVSGMRGSYPSLDKALEKLTEGFRSIALDRDIALSNTGDKDKLNVFFRRDKIGTYTKSTNTVFVPGGVFSGMFSQFLGKHRWIVT